MKTVESYISDLRDIRATGAAVKETSYYGALEKLMNEIGDSLKPKVRCVMQLKNQGAGMPDGGLFSARQFKRKSSTPTEPENPERGVIEVKGTGDNAWLVADSKQVSKYWQKYRQVLVTNYRDFVLVGQDANGQPVKLETYRLAESEEEFWQKANNPSKLAAEQAEQFTEYLKRVMLQSAAIATPKDVAWFLASYAKDARSRIEKTELPVLKQIRQALEEALGVSFEGKKGDRFFKSALIQTLFYGIFSAWVLWHKQNKQGNFQWQMAAWDLHVPTIKALFEKVATPTNLGKLDLVEVLDWTGDALNRVDTEAFFSQFEEGQAVQYFYEPFLEAFDPKLRKDLGVWYTPPEVVEYMVERVDGVLREELEISDGLADPNVYILDPCCGTGAYLVEVLKRIDATLEEKGLGALVGSQLKEAAKNRVFGFEILTAPFVVAHLQLGLLLQNLGVPLLPSERVGVYLTNALTGWEPPTEEAKVRYKQLSLNFPELGEEKDAADEVKRGKPILVVLGNPPYNAFAGVSPKEEEGLVDIYKKGLIKDWGIKKFNLDDLYVRFFRLAEYCITDIEPKKGVVCYISNFSYLRDPSYVVMRQRFLREFDRLWFDCLNGDSRETGKLTPEGKPDPSVFSTEYNREGIRVGTAIALMVRNEQRQDKPMVRFRHFWGVNKREDLVQSLKADGFNDSYEQCNPTFNNRYSFRFSEVEEPYYEWPKLTEFCALAPSNGLMEKRGGALIDIDRDALEQRMRAYLDPELSWDNYAALNYGLVKDQARFDPKVARRKLLLAEQFDRLRLKRYALRPFDIRWCYYTGVRPVWNEPRPSLWKQCWPGNQFLLTRFNASKDNEGVPFYFTPCLSDDHLLTPDAVAVPLQLMNGARLRPKEQLSLLDLLPEKPEVDRPFANLSEAARNYLAGLGFPNPDEDRETSGLIWMHALAIGYSPAYLAENADGIRQDWPRIPLPDNRETLLASAQLGGQIAALLDTETPTPGITSGKIRPELRAVAVVVRVGGGNLNPDTEFAVTASWGYGGKNGITMPGKGKIAQRPYSPEERKAMGEATGQLGEDTRDVYLNDVAYWQNIPARVWDYTIGGYQVIKKWLSYREEDLLGRPLKVSEVQEVTNMARRIGAILLLEPELDANYEAVKRSPYQWRA
ncbi:MAG: N-6 DNA methylase [Hormoscilla sp. GUM202]|nr:N-6 DNA methylase [Hormoscilla sp. GUM202]